MKKQYYVMRMKGWWLMFLLVVFVANIKAQVNPEQSAKKADELAQIKDYEGAIRNINYAIRDGAKPEYYYKRAIYQKYTKQWNTAWTEAGKIPQMFPDSSEAYLYTIDFYLTTTTDITMAVSVCDSAIKHFQHKNDSLGLLFENLRKGMSIIFQRYVLELVAVMPDTGEYVEPDTANAYVLVDIAMLYDELGLWQHEVNLLNRAIQLHPENYLAYNNIGFCYSQLGQHKTAWPYLDKSIAINKNKRGKEYKIIRGYSYSNRGYVKFMLGKYKSALKDYKMAEELTPSDSYLYKYYALYYISKNKMKEACEYLKKAKRLGYKDMYGTEVDELLKKHCK